jgi:hypothetical protein
MKQLFFAFCLLLTTMAGRTQDTAGTYLPTILSHTSTINPIPQITHFIKVDSEVYVYGSVFANGNPKIGFLTSFSVSLPIPSTLVPALLAYGQSTVIQSSPPAVAGGVHVQSGAMQIFWTPTVSLPAQVFYSFAYTVQ